MLGAKEPALGGVSGRVLRSSLGCTRCGLLSGWVVPVREDARSSEGGGRSCSVRESSSGVAVARFRSGLRPLARLEELFLGRKMFFILPPGDVDLRVTDSGGRREA